MGELKIPGFIVGIEFYSGTEGDYQSLSVYSVECSSYEEVEELAAKNGGTLTATKHDIPDATVGDLLKLFKRFNVTLSPQFKSVKEIVYET